MTKIFHLSYNLKVNIHNMIPIKGTVQKVLNKVHERTIFRAVVITWFVFLTLTPLTSQHHIIPQPVQFTSTSGSFVLDPMIHLQLPVLGEVAQSGVEALCLSWKDLGVNVDQINNKSNKKLLIKLTPSKISTLGEEGYELEILKDTIQLIAAKEAGVLYGLQSLIQLSPLPGSPSILPQCKIVDYPRFKWRGLMMDVSRHFRTVSEVKHFIDYMSTYKFNVLHLHLTDDQGWRIEIKSLPKLTEIGSCRVPRTGNFWARKEPQPDEKATDCGFYTQEEIKDIVRYAGERNIQVLPEVDVPGHSMAAIAAYPYLSVTRDPNITVNPGSKFSEWLGGGKFTMSIDNSLDPTNEEVYIFLDKVFTEIAELFPFPYIHMGGDECYHGFWEKSKEVQQFMTKNDIKDSHGMQSYFVTRVEKIISAKGKKMIGWDEILEGGLTPNATVMSWRGNKGGIEAASMGHEVVMTPNTNAYLDLYQGEPLVEPMSYSRLYLKTCYDFEPVPEGVDPKLILGGQGNLWAERFPTYRSMQYMAYPRAWALSEVYWSPKENKSWTNFVDKMEQHFVLNDRKNVKYSRAAYDAITTFTRKNGKIYANISCEIPNTDIHYTHDGTLPDQYSTKYTQPFEVPEGDLTLRVVTYRNGKLSGRIINFEDDLIRLRAK